MSKGVLFAIIGLVVLVLVIALALNAFVGGLRTTSQPEQVLDEAFNPEPEGQPPGAAPVRQQAAAMPPLGSMPAAVRADDTPPPPRPEPPRVDTVSGPWGRNPFLTMEEIDFLRNPRKYDVEPEPPAVRLTTILTVNGKPTAALNGHYVTVGDYFGTEKVVGISRYSLTLQRENGKTREIKLHELVIDVRARSSRP